jgi:DNA-binding NarL/FixJ family response regulator
MSDTIRVLVAEDHPIVRDGLRAIAASTDDIEIVAEVASANDVPAALADARPDVVIMDLDLAGTSGIDAIRAVLDHDASIAVLVLTMSNDHASVVDAMRAGARGYLV